MFHVMYVALSCASTGQQIQANEQICITSALIAVIICLDQ